MVETFFKQDVKVRNITRYSFWRKRYTNRRAYLSKAISGRRQKNLALVADSEKGASGTGVMQEKGDLLFIATIHHYIYYQLTHHVQHGLGDFKTQFRRKSYITQQV